MKDNDDDDDVDKFKNKTSQISPHIFYHLHNLYKLHDIP
jgi:hypothetical protein